MSPAQLTRRALVRAAGAALGAAALPAGIGAAVSAATAPTGLPGAVPLAFDPAAYLADLRAAGYGISAYYDVPRGGERAGPSSYLIRSPKGRGFGAPYTAVMAKWWDAMDACPDHVERVVEHVFAAGRHREAKRVLDALARNPRVA